MNESDKRLNSGEHFLSEYSKYLDSSGEHLSYAALSTYINFKGELSQKERSFLESHLDTCTSCTSRLREVQEVENEKVQPLSGTRRWFSSTVFRYSVAAVLVLALGVVLMVYMQTDRSQKQLASRPPSSTQPFAAQTVDPERFTTNPLLDGFIERTVRSALTANFRVPHTGDTVQTPIHFAWDSMMGPFSLTIVDNKNNTIFTTTTSRSRTDVDTSFMPGLYYAKLYAASNLSSVTKFYILPR
jgi:Putative zinc-finger